MEPREGHLGIASPGLGEGAGQVGLLRDQVLSPIAPPAGLDEENTGRLGKQISDE